MIQIAITGKADIWLNNKPIGEKATFDAAPITVAIPPGEGDRTLSVLIEASPGKPAGLGGPVTMEEAQNP